MDKKYGNKYEVACAILEKLEQGGSGGGGGDVALVDGTKLRNSTFTEVPEYYDFSEITDFNSMFYQCKNLTTIPQQFDTSNGTNFYGMFYRCSKLRSVPQLDVSKGTNFESMFNSCNALTTIPQLDLSNGTNFSSMFRGCNSLANISFVGSINYSIAFSGGILNSMYAELTDESIKSILTACSNTTNTSSKTLSFKLSSSRVISDPNGEFAALVSSCTTKGWTITGLTLE